MKTPRMTGAFFHAWINVLKKFMIFMLVMAGLIGLRILTYDPFPKQFRTPIGGVPFSNDAIRAALKEIKADKHVIKPSYNVLNEEREWIVSREDGAKSDNADHIKYCALLKRYGLTDRFTGVDIGYRVNKADPGLPAHKGKYYCEQGGFKKGFVPPDKVEKIIADIKQLPDAVSVAYREAHPRWIVGVKPVDQARRHGLRGICGVLRKWKLHQDHFSALIVDAIGFQRRRTRECTHYSS